MAQSNWSGPLYSEGGFYQGKDDNDPNRRWVAPSTVDLSGAITGLVRPDGVVQPLPAPNSFVTPGTTVLDFAAGPSIAASTSTQSSCVAVWNPTGWVDGSGCLEITPNNDGFCEFRMFFDAPRQFDLWSDDGCGVEFWTPSMEDKANPSFSLVLGRGATSTAAPSDTIAFRLYSWVTGVPRMQGHQYIRNRWDITTADSKAGPFPGLVNPTTGAGVNRTHTINWLRFQFNAQCGGKTIKFRRIVRGGRSRPCIVLGTDSAAFRPLSELVSAYIAQLGWRWSINQYFGGGNGVDDLPVSRDTIRAIYAGGNDFNINDLIDRNLGSAGLTAAQAEAMARACLDKARGYGWTRGSNIFIYNNNAYTTEVVQGLRAAGVVAGRGGALDGRFVFPEQSGVTNPMRIPAASWDQMTTAQMTVQVDRAIEYGASAWVYWHNVFSTARVADDGQTPVGALTPSAYAAANPSYCTPRGIDGLTVWWEELRGALDYIKTQEMAGRIDVLSPSQWCARFGVPAIVG